MNALLSKLRLLAFALPLQSTAGWGATLPTGIVDALPVDCRQLSAQAYTFTEHRLPNSAEARLWIVACARGSYQSAYALVYGSPESKYRSLMFAERREGTWTGTDRVYDPVYDEKTGGLSDHYKLIGTGQCGGDRHWRWAGRDFQLVQYRVQENCDSQGGGFYPQVFPLQCSKP